MPLTIKKSFNLSNLHILVRNIRLRHIQLSLVDLLVLLQFLLLLANYMMHPSAVADVEFYKIATIAFSYSVARVVISQSPKHVEWLLLIATSVWCCYEAVLGLMQVFGSRASNHFLYACTGTFFNPGPFGGFLAVCVSMLVASLTITKSKMWQYVAGTIVFVVAIILPSTMSRSALLGLGCSIMVLALSVDKWRKLIRKYWCVILLALIVACTGAYLFKKNSANGRVLMNKISVRAMLGSGLSGVGLGMFTGEYGEQQHDYFASQIVFDNGNIDMSAINERERLACDCPERAFNEYLALGVEAGPIAMLLFVAIIALSTFKLLKHKLPFAYGLITLAVFAIFSYPFDIPEFQIMLAIFLAYGATIEGGGNAASTLGAFVTIIILCWIFANQHSEQKLRASAEAEWSKTDYWYRQEYYNYVVEDGDSLMPKLEHNYRSLFEYGQSLNREGQYSKSDSVLKLGAAISSDPMFWNVMGNNSLAQGKYDEAEERYRHAFAMVPNRLYPLYLMAKLYDAEGDTLKFLNVAKQMESFSAKIESANTEKLRNEIIEIKSRYIRQ